MRFLRGSGNRVAALMIVILLATPQAFSKFKESEVAKCLLENLRVASKKQVSGSRSNLPKSADLVVGKPEAKDLFNRGVNLWRQSWTDTNIRDLRNFAQRLKDGKTVDKVTVSEVNTLRADLKLMRFWFASLSADHKIPKNFDELTAAIGKLRDVPTLGLWYQEQERPQRVLDALKPKRLKAMEKEIRQFKPTSQSEFLDWSEKVPRKICIRFERTCRPSCQ